MLNIGAGEIAIILVVALLVLGPKRLPEMARGIGKFMREFRRQTDEVRTTLQTEFYRMDRELMAEEPKKQLPPNPAAPVPQQVPATQANAMPTFMGPLDGGRNVAEELNRLPAPVVGADAAPTEEVPAPVAEAAPPDVAPAAAPQVKDSAS